MNRGRRKTYGKLLADVAKYAVTVLLGLYVLKPESVPPGALVRGLCLAVLSAVIGWFVYPKGDE